MQRYFVRIEDDEGFEIESADDLKEAKAIKAEVEQKRPDARVSYHPSPNNLPIFDGLMSGLFGE